MGSWGLSKYTIIVCLSLAFATGVLARPPEAINIDDLLKKMTLDEKLNLLGGSGDGFTVPGNPKYHIPALVMTDGAVGVNRIKAGTAFPASIALAATFDPEMAEKMAYAIGTELQDNGQNVLLGPCVNIARIPLGGRVYEGYGEDPYLAGQIAGAYVQGAKAAGVMTTVKHYALNNQEFERMTVDVNIDDKTMHDLYLPAFKAAIDAGSVGVMASYNKIRGEYASENSWLLNDLLKTQMGFKGFVVSDWGAVHSSLPSALNGLDIEMPFKQYFSGAALKSSLDKKEISMELIDNKVRRILWAMDQMKYLEDGAKPVLDTNQSRNVALEVAQKSIVLLKNKNNILPLKTNAEKRLQVAFIGPSANHARTGGGGSAYVPAPQALTPFEAFNAKINSLPIDLHFAQGTVLAADPIASNAKLFRASFNQKNIEGLKGEYFNNPDLANDPVLVRIDNTLKFDWGWNSPDPIMPSQYFSIRWTGEFLPEQSGDHEFLFSFDDGMRFFIDDKLVIDKWENETAQGGLRVAHYRAPFEAGKSYAIRIEYVQKETLATFYASVREPQNGALSDDMLDAVALAKKSDVAFVFVGLSNKLESEGFDRTDFNLPQDQVELIQKVASNNPNTVVVIEAGSPVDISWAEGVAGLIYAWYPGQEGASALSDILLGNINPSGKLPLTMPKTLASVPAMRNYPSQNFIETYSENMHVGYRGITDPAYSFGFGLSYSNFQMQVTEVAPTNLLSTDPMIAVSATVTNDSDVDGSEVVEIFLRHPDTQDYWNLKQFQKIAVAAHSSQNLILNLTKKDFQEYDTSIQNPTVYPGVYKIQAKIGSSLKTSESEITLK